MATITDQLYHRCIYRFFVSLWYLLAVAGFTWIRKYTACTFPSDVFQLGCSPNNGMDGNCCCRYKRPKRFLQKIWNMPIHYAFSRVSLISVLSALRLPLRICWHSFFTTCSHNFRPCNDNLVLVCTDLLSGQTK